MRSRSASPRWSRFYILDAKNRPVQVLDQGEWSRWMAENELIFRRTLMEDSGVVVTTRFRGVSERAPKDTPLFVTRVVGKVAEENESYGAHTLDEALEQHEQLVQKLIRALRAADR
ncbi:hypothetical protein [Cupriavidus sp. CuC1]|uniref:hypothetical protein n=1 Tax=Cupriavidus sp. CuC1 TaxID=3373131 RepID=UPI0037CDCE7B